MSWQWKFQSSKKQKTDAYVSLFPAIRFRWIISRGRHLFHFGSIPKKEKVIFFFFFTLFRSWTSSCPLLKWKSCIMYLAITTLYYLYISCNPDLHWFCVLNVTACKCSNLTCSLSVFFIKHTNKSLYQVQHRHMRQMTWCPEGGWNYSCSFSCSCWSWWNCWCCRRWPICIHVTATGAGRANGAKASSDQQKRTNVLSGYRISIGPPRVTESHLKPNFAAHKQGRAARCGGEELFKAAVLQCKDCRWRRRRLQISR